MDCEFAFVCDYAEQDRKLHAVGIGWDVLYAREVPTAHPSMTFVARMRGSVAEAGAKKVQIRIIDADGEDVIPPIEQQMPFEVKPGQLEATANVLVNLQQIRFEKYGEYAIHLLVQDEEKKTVHFRVSEIPPTA